MKNSKIVKVILIVSGVIAAAIGAAILFTPISFYASYGITLGNNVSLLNEIRAPGGALFAMGILIVSGAFVKKITYTAMVISALLFLSYSLSRVIAIAFDGVPVNGLVQATMLESLIGLACAYALLKYRTPDKVVV